MFYSPSTRGFYDARTIDDAVQITPELYVALFDAQAIGKEIVPGSDGYPVAVDRQVSAPTSVSPAQARLALHSAGLLAQVEAIVATADVPTQIAWNNATVIERSSPTVAALAGALDLTDAQLDDLFTTAAGIFV